MNILVAEDEPVNRAVMSQMLRRMGYQADFVENGAEALAAAKRKSYGVILMDIQMPQMNGFVATREILKAAPEGEKPIIIAVTALARDGIRDQCAQAGMSDYLHKPVDANELRNMLGKWEQSAFVQDAAGEEKSAKAENELYARLDLLGQETDASFMNELLDMFLVNTPAQLEKLRKGFDESNAKVVHSVGHALKGSSLNIGASRLASLCKTIEEAGEENRLDDARRLIDDVVREYEQLQSALRRYQERLK